MTTRGSASTAFTLIWLALGTAAQRPLLAADSTNADDAVELEESMEIDIRSPSEATVRYSDRIQVLTQHGIDEFGKTEVAINPWMTLRDFRGAVISPDGKRTEIKKQQVYEVAYSDDELYNELRKKALDFAGLVPGATIEYQHERSMRSLFFLPDVFPLQDLIPSRLKILTVRVPASVAVRFIVRDASPEYTHEEKDGAVVHRWVVRDVPALRGEPAMPPVIDIIPRVMIYPKEIIWDERHIDTSTWDGIAAWAWDLGRDRRTPTPEVEQKAKELTAGAADPETKMRRLYEFVQAKINYVNIYLGIGGWQPHASGDVLRHRYGDCKDKATLLIAMLQSVGLKGLPALINTRDGGLTDRDAPAPSFNHQIVAIPGEDGGYLFLDPTAEGISYGELPPDDQGVPILVVKSDGRGDLVETPLASPEKNRLHVRVVAQLKPTGDLEGTYEVQGWGLRRDQLNSLASTNPTVRETALADFMSLLSPGAKLQSQEVKPAPDAKSPATATLRFTLPRFTIRAGTREVISPYVVHLKILRNVTAYPQRRFPILLNGLSQDTSETRLQLPPGRTLKKTPEGQTLNGPGLSATSQFQLVKEQDHQVLIVKRSVTVSRREIPASDYPALRAFVSSLSEEEARAVTMETEAIASAPESPAEP